MVLRKEIHDAFKDYFDVEIVADFLLREEDVINFVDYFLKLKDSDEKQTICDTEPPFQVQ